MQIEINKLVNRHMRASKNKKISTNKEHSFHAVI